MLISGVSRSMGIHRIHDALPSTALNLHFESSTRPAGLALLSWHTGWWNASPGHGAENANWLVRTVLLIHESHREMKGLGHWDRPDRHLLSRVNLESNHIQFTCSFKLFPHEYCPFHWTRLVTSVSNKPASMPQRISPPTRRHSAPSGTSFQALDWLIKIELFPTGPWPFIDIDDEVPNADTISTITESPLLLASPTCKHSNRSFQELCWCRYPQSLFHNWTLLQQKKSKLNKVIGTLGESSLHYLDIMQDGTFVNAGLRELSIRNLDEHLAAIQGEVCCIWLLFHLILHWLYASRGLLEWEPLQSL